MDWNDNIQSNMSDMISGLAGKQQQKQQRDQQHQQNMKMMLDNGIATAEQPTSKDLQESIDQAGQGAKIEFAGNATEEDKVKLLNAMADSFHIQKPKAKIKIDYQKAAQAGMQYDPNTESLQFRPANPSMGSHKLPMAQQLQDMQDIQTAKDQGRIPKDVGYQGGDLKDNTLVRGEKEQQFNQKEWDKIVKTSDPSIASSRSTLGMAANANLRADRALITLNRPHMTYQDAQNVVADVAGIYAGGAPSDQGMSHSQYETIQSKIAGLQQFLSGSPTDAVPDNIKSHMKEVITDLRKTNKAAIKQHFDYVEKSQPNVIKNYKDEWQGMKDSAIPQEEDVTGTPQFQAIQAGQQGGGQQGGQGLPSQSQAPRGAKGWSKSQNKWVF